MNPPISQLYPLQVNSFLPEHAIPRPPAYTYANPNAMRSSISLPSFREFCVGLHLPFDVYNKPVNMYSKSVNVSPQQPSFQQGSYFSQQVYPPQNYQPQNYTVYTRGPSISSLDGSPEEALIQLRYSDDSRRLLMKSETNVKIPKKRGRKKKANTICTQCRLENTPEWRKGPEGSRTLCNACGLFYLKLTKRFGTRQAGTIMKVKKSRNEIHDRLVPTDEQKDEMCSHVLV